MTSGLEEVEVKQDLLPKRRSWLARSPLRRPLVVLSVLILLTAVLFAIAPGLFWPGDPMRLGAGPALAAPSWSEPFGTDQFGRSVLGQVIHGSRAAMMIGLLSVAIALTLGGLIGLLSGYFGGSVDMVLMRGIDVLMVFPSLLLALMFAAGLGPSLFNLIVAVGVASVPYYARVTRGQVLAVRSRPYIDAAAAVGIPKGRILFRHVVPNAITPLVVVATLGVANGILLGASLSFLGVGPTTGVPDWGRLLAAGEPFLGSAWWISTFPGLVVTLVVIAVNILGDHLRDVLDVSK